MDVDEYRRMISEFSDLQLFDEKCSFYYDETGNVRKFRLTENGVNAEEGIEMVGVHFIKIPCTILMKKLRQK